METTHSTLTLQEAATIEAAWAALQAVPSYIEQQARTFAEQSPPTVVLGDEGDPSCSLHTRAEGDHL